MPADRELEPTAPDEASMLALVGHRFPGGTYRIAHWEAWLLNDCTGAAPLAGGLVHPIALFHVPILGARTSIAELFALCGGSGAGSVGLEGYDWEYAEALHEEVDYRCEGGIVEVERVTTSAGRVFDRVAFRIELFDAGGRLVAAVTNRWRFYRSAP